MGRTDPGGFWAGAAVLTTGFGVTFAVLGRWIAALLAGILAIICAQVAKRAWGGAS